MPGMQKSRSTKIHLRDPNGITKGPACGSRSPNVTTSFGHVIVGGKGWA